jgi:hypothetical protein
MTVQGERPFNRIEILNRFRFHINRAESTGRITPGFAARLRQQTDQAEARFKAPSQMPLLRKNRFELWIN